MSVEQGGGETQEGAAVDPDDLEEHGASDVTDSVGAPAAEGKTAQAQGPEMFPSTTMTEQFQTLFKRTMFRFEEEVRDAAGQWADTIIPTTVRELHQAGVELTDELLLGLEETRSFWTGTESRFRECARCLPRSAVCADSAEQDIGPGTQVRLRVIVDNGEARVARVARRCARYEDVVMSKRLIAAGVDKRLAGMRLQRIDNPLFLEPATQAFGLFLDHRQRKDAMTLLIQGGRSSEYAAALVAASFAAGHRDTSWRNLPRLIRQEKEAITLNERRPLQQLLEGDVLALDEFKEEFWKSEHWKSEIFFVLNRRQAAGLGTIITTRIMSELRGAFPETKVLVVERFR